MEEAERRYRWVEDLVDSDEKALGTYLAILYLLGPHGYMDYSKVGKPSGNFIMTTAEVKSWLAFYFAGRVEGIREAYETVREFVDRLFMKEPSKTLKWSERDVILSEIELTFYDKFLKALKKYLKFDNIPEELRVIVRDVLFDVRSQLYEGLAVTHAGTIIISESELRKSIESHRGLKEEDANKLISCLEKSGLVLKYSEYYGYYVGFVNVYIFPAPCLSDEVIELLVSPEKLSERPPAIEMELFFPPPPMPEHFNEKPSGKILEEIVTYVFRDLGFSVIPNRRSPSKTGSQIEVDVWAWKKVDNIKFSVYVSCKNWNKPIDRQVIDEETGRVMNLREVPQLKIIIAKQVSKQAKDLAEANGFVIIELGEKANAENAKEIYELVYRSLNKIFTSIAPPKLMGIVSRIVEARETLKREP
jgi:hypothetical protein